MSTNNNNLKVTSAILAATLGSASLCACSTTGDITTPTVDTAYVRVADGVTPDMMNSSYWLTDKDEEILMTASEIDAFNQANRVRITTGNGLTMPYLNEFEDTMDSASLRDLLGGYLVPSDPSAYYLNGEPTTKEYWENLKLLANEDAIGDVINVRFGFTVQRATLRLFPTDDRVFDDPEDQYFDSMLFSECMPYMPVVILHESLDGEFLFAVFDSFAGWVRKDAVAICSSKEDWTARQSGDDWLTVTAREIRLGDDPYVGLNRDLVLPMGTRMQLVKADQVPDSVNQRTTYGNYVVKVPTRGSDGCVKDELVLIPMSDDVTVGSLPYTPANVVRQAFKLLGDRYGWGGDLRANDCTGIVREIYRCFGIFMPRVNQSKVTGVATTDMSEMSDSEKLDVIKKLSPGSLISFPGHMMIYLGTVDDIPYVISATGTFVAPAPGPEDKIHPDSVIINGMNVRRANLKTWLESAQTALTVKSA